MNISIFPQLAKGGSAPSQARPPFLLSVGKIDEFNDVSHPNKEAAPVSGLNLELLDARCHMVRAGSLRVRHAALSTVVMEVLNRSTVICCAAFASSEE